MIALVVLLVTMLALRVLAAAGEAMVAERLPRTTAVSDSTLAAVARAAAMIGCGATVGIATALVWATAKRGAVPVAIVVLVPIGLVLFDLVPRGLTPGLGPGARRAIERGLLAAGVLLAPVVALGIGLGWLTGRRESAAGVEIGRFGGWLASRPRRGPLDVSESGLVARLARFEAKTAGDAMVSQVDVCAVPDTAPVGEVIGLIRQRGYSRLPVFHERLFNVTGIVSTFDLLGVVDPKVRVVELMHEPFFVPQGKPLPELLAALQAAGRHVALVVDEYGGFVGLVTVEDLVEEIVGEIEDEYDRPQELLRRVAPNVFVVSARASVADLNERFGWNLPQGEYETVGGLVLERLGRIPKPGDGLRAGRVQIDVTRASARAVLELRVTVRG
jgi:putative hemolysin